MISPTHKPDCPNPKIRVPHLRDSFIVAKVGFPSVCWWGGKVGIRAKREPLSSPNPKRPGAPSFAASPRRVGSTISTAQEVA